ncbi:unnamed protein product [Symbiodinium sp. CCMP2456]|nr:unnamed protein product [Symbiodinium sp. CCMP2456]
MSARQRLSADPAEMLAKMFVGWYSKHKVHFKEVQNFEPAVWAFKDGWVVHKMFTLLRPKVMRTEQPRADPGPQPLEAGAEVEDDDQDEPLAPMEYPDELVEGEASPNAVDREALFQAMEGEASQAMEGEASSEAMEGEASSEAMQGEAREAVDRQSLSREQKLRIDSAAAGYRLAHTTSEAWGDEHMPKTPPDVSESEEPLAEPSLLTQKTFLDETPHDESSPVCVVDSSPDEASTSSRPSALSRIGSFMPRNPDQEETQVPEAEPSLENLIEQMAPSPPRESCMELGSKVSEEDEPKAKKAKAAQKSIAADAKETAEAAAKAKGGPKPKNSAGNAMQAKATSSKKAPTSKGKTDAQARAEPASESKAEADDPKPKAKPGPKPKRAKADDPEEPEPVSEPGPKPMNAKADDPEEPVSKPGPKPRKAKADDPEEPVVAKDNKSQVKAAKPKGKAAMKKPAAKMPAPAPGPHENDVDLNVAPLESELPKTFARRAVPTTASGINKYRRIVGAFRDYVMPKLKDGQKCAAEDSLGS